MNRGLSALELLVAISMSGLAMFFMTNILGVSQKVQQQFNLVSQADSLVADLTRALQDESLCICNFRGLKFGSNGAEALARTRVPADFYLYDESCEKKGFPVAIQGQKLSHLLSIRSLQLQELSMVTLHRAQAQIEIEFEKKLSMASVGGATLRRRIPLVLGLRNDGDHQQATVVRCGPSIEGERYDGVETVYKKISDDSVFIDFMKHPDALYAWVKVWGNRVDTLEEMKKRNFPEAKPEKESPKIQYGADFEEMSILLDFRNNSSLGTYNFVGTANGNNAQVTHFGGPFGNSVEGTDGIPFLTAGRTDSDPAQLEPLYTTEATGRRSDVKDPHMVFSWAAMPNTPGFKDFLMISKMARAPWEQLWVIKYYR